MTYLLVSVLIAFAFMLNENKHGLRTTWTFKDNCRAFVMDIIFWPVYFIMCIFNFVKGRK